MAVYEKDLRDEFVMGRISREEKQFMMEYTIEGGPRSKYSYVP